MELKLLFATVALLSLVVGVYILQNKPQVPPPDIPVALERNSIIDEWYAPLYPMTIGSTTVLASIADTSDTRAKGLSGTPYLPEGIAKLFIFNESKPWSFWMKDMNYAIDIIWVDEAGLVVHIETAVSPASYPKTFVPSAPAKYVVEVPSGYAEQNGIVAGTIVELPSRD